MSRVLVTGATGAIGTEVVDTLRREDWTVRTTSRTADGADHIRADLLDPDDAALLAAIEPDAVVHLAGASGSDVSELFPVNVLGTAHLLEALAPSTRVIVVGSAAEYGAGTGQPISEATPLRPVSPYGWAKAAQTTTAVAIARRRDLALTVVRPFNVFGPGMPERTALGNLRRQLEHGVRGATATVIAGRLDVVRDYVAAGVVADTLSGVLADADPPAVLNVCSGIGIALGDILDEMGTMLDVDIDFEVDPRLEALPAPDAVVGDPSLLIARYGAIGRPTAHDVARAVLGANSAGDHR